MSIVSELTESKSKLDALLTYANGVTGAADANIGDAIRTLANGYGGGSGDGIRIDVGTFKLATSSLSSSGTSVKIQHNLGAIPDGIIVWSDEFTPDITKTGGGNDVYGFVWFRDLFKNPMRGSSTTTIPLENGLTMYFTYNQTADNISGSFPSSASYTYSGGYTSQLSAAEFPLLRVGSNTYWTSQVTYRYAVFKKFW